MAMTLPRYHRVLLEVSDAWETVTINLDGSGAGSASWPSESQGAAVGQGELWEFDSVAFDASASGAAGTTLVQVVEGGGGSTKHLADVAANSKRAVSDRNSPIRVGSGKKLTVALSGYDANLKGVTVSVHYIIKQTMMADP